MLSEKLTRTRRFGLSGLLLLFLANCDPIQQPPTTPPPASRPVEVVAPTEALTSLCLAWFNSLATWADADTEKTKDLIDYAYRVHEEVCAPYLK